MNNIYDNKEFYDAYAQMSRSKDGLKAAGEWYQLQALFPPLEGKSVLDLGCGYGWHSKYAADEGALSVLGLDLSERMIGEARKRNSADNVTYKVCGVEEYEYPEASYDFVISNLVLHYIADLDPIFEKVFQTLRPGGIFLFNIEHPVFTAGVNEDWLYGEDGTPTVWPIDNYFYPGERQTLFLGQHVTKQHHTLTQILMGVIHTGFILEHIEEAKPSKEMMNMAGMKDEMRRPMMLLVRVRKQ
ncbi:class I SAM-dependent methyltransferase [Roseburia hominis]